MSTAAVAQGRLQFVASTGSTNADLLARIKAGDPPLEGEWLVAGRQTAGKGRLGRSWQDGRGNFMGSTAIRLHPSDPAPATMSLVAGVALYEAVAPLLAPPTQAQLKWPNDLMLKGAKLAGILLERSADYVVAGFGVNLAQAPTVEGRATTALNCFGPAPDRDLFASALAGSLTEELIRWRTYGLDPLIRRWQAAAHPQGTVLTIAVPGEAPVTGRFAGLSEDGSLRPPPERRRGARSARWRCDAGRGGIGDAFGHRCRQYQRRLRPVRPRRARQPPHPRPLAHRHRSAPDGR